MTWSFNIALVKNMEMQMACPESPMIQNSVTAMKQVCSPHHFLVEVVPSAPKSITNGPVFNLMLMTLFPCQYDQPAWLSH